MIAASLRGWLHGVPMISVQKVAGTADTAAASHVPIPRLVRGSTTILIRLGP
jgi:hypothetical protein